MLIQSLEYLAQSALALAQSREVLFLGSSSLLASFPRPLELGKIYAEDLRKRWSSMPLGKQEIFRSGRNWALVVEGSWGR
jgi:hypothetical protein